jgi:hypothetical protein
VKPNTASEEYSLQLKGFCVARGSSLYGPQDQIMVYEPLISPRADWMWQITAWCPHGELTVNISISNERTTSKARGVTVFERLLLVGATKREHPWMSPWQP